MFLVFYMLEQIYIAINAIPGCSDIFYGEKMTFFMNSAPNFDIFELEFHSLKPVMTQKSLLMVLFW